MKRKRLVSSKKYRDLTKKLENQLIDLMIADCMQCKARLYNDILETISDIIIFVKEED